MKSDARGRPARAYEAWAGSGSLETLTEPQIIGVSASIEKIRKVIRRVADVGLTVLVTGESGVGKELVARALHYYSRRREHPFLKVNCAALPGELMESELFGYEKGAFTGADRLKRGKFEAAGEGSIFLDEIGEIPLPLQAKLLQVLQDLKYARVGGNEEVHTKARVIAATNINLQAEITRGRFREDLYFRINTININVPPLRERKEDLEPLIQFFLRLFKKEHGLDPYPVPDRLMKLFHAYHWPGNVRELENYLKRLCVLRSSDEIEAEIRRSLEDHAPYPKFVTFVCKDLDGQNRDNPLFLNIHVTNLGYEGSDNGPRSAEEFVVKKAAEEIQALTGSAETFPSLKEIRDRAVERVERAILEYVLREVNWNRRKAAKILKVSYRTLLYKLKEMDLRP